MLEKEKNLKMRLSSIVLTKNEENSIERCLKSLAFCDEIIVVDDYSEDKTVEIAKKFKAKIFQKRLEDNFADQRNFGLSKISSDWAIFVDADEEISQDLSKEILAEIDTKYFEGFYLKRKDYAFGRWLKYGETANVKFLRLGRSKCVWERPVHELWKITGPVGILKNPLNHYSHHNVVASLKKINYYSSLEADFRQREKTGFLKIVFYPIGKFIKNFILLLGFLDSMPGFLIAGLMSAHSFLVRVKIWEKQNRVAEKYS